MYEITQNYHQLCDLNVWKKAKKKLQPTIQYFNEIWPIRKKVWPPLVYTVKVGNSELSVFVCYTHVITLTYKVYPLKEPIGTKNIIKFCSLLLEMESLFPSSIVSNFGNFRRFLSTSFSTLTKNFTGIFRLESHVWKFTARDGQVVWSGLVNLRWPHSRRRGCNVVWTGEKAFLGLISLGWLQIVFLDNGFN